MSIDINEILEIDPSDPTYQPLLEEIQGNILKSHGRDRSRHLFLTFNSNIDAAKAWIGNFANNYVTSAMAQYQQGLSYRQTKKSTLFANIFLSMAGYMHLKFDYGEVPNDPAFRSGMKSPNTQFKFNDPPVSEWDEGFQNELHALVLIADDSQEVLDNMASTLKSELAEIAETISEEHGFVLREDPRDSTSPVIEHFGFRDGVSQPLFMKKDIDKARQVDQDFSQWDPRAPLKLVLFKDPFGKEAESYGSFLLYRKLEQNVKGWKQDVRALAGTLDVPQALAGAYAVGRFQDGTPVVLSSTGNNEGNPTTTNNFNYFGDRQGSKCPFHAHIRKTNPRGDTGELIATPVPLEEEKMHRIARRGISYGSEDPTSEPETGSGLLFLCFQANIGNQFEFIQQNWASEADFVNQGVGSDPVIGPSSNGTENYNWSVPWGTTEKKTGDFTHWVTMKGGEYFFAPSLSFLKDLAPS